MKPCQVEFDAAVRTLETLKGYNHPSATQASVQAIAIIASYLPPLPSEAFAVGDSVHIRHGMKVLAIKDGIAECEFETFAKASPGDGTLGSIHVYRVQIPVKLLRKVT